MSNYYYDEDYDAYDHMTNDPFDFQMYGYGGFGYDTSHIQPDEPRSEICIKASTGDLHGVIQIVERASSDEQSKTQVINHARKMSGFTKEWEWYDLTPLAMAATLGHHDIVEYLLRQGADPTLLGCPTENVTVGALTAAEKNLEYVTKQKDENKCNQAQRCIDLISVASLFWKSAKYSGSRYGKKTRAVFSNRPTIPLYLLNEALDYHVPSIEEYPGDYDFDLEGIKNQYTRVATIVQEQEESCCDDGEDSEGDWEGVDGDDEENSCYDDGNDHGENSYGKDDYQENSHDDDYDENSYDDSYEEDNSYDSTEITFYRPDGDIETKDIKWCKDNGFYEVEIGLWSGDWYYETDLKTRKSLTGCVLTKVASRSLMTRRKWRS